MPRLPRVGPLTLVALVLAAVLAFSLGSAGPAAAARTCKPKGSDTIAANKVARVYRSADANRLYGCLKSRRKPLLLADLDDPNVQIAYNNVRLAGRVVGFHLTRDDQSCKADCPPDFDGRSESVNVTSLSRRRTRSISTPALAAAPADRSPSLVVNTRGAIAWITPAGAARALHVSTRTGDDRTVDSGDVDIEGFRGALLLWSKPLGNGRWINTSGEGRR